ncbi:peroxisomal d3,d2-enoyl-CoA isomerase-like protein [Cenococcum geophilum 1.58]|uniref:peroxisomal d3,d2-enoyl-CoA isomerase-like protein n=1 Tax=Cenococcum geophilum 1.58 TaxID=794803 RepID=UPI00358EF4CF|nr:peroxisomal d3,d2-enoyl-CoA isomeras-like protein [Cenococcum geophilum 1.58]
MSANKYTDIIFEITGKIGIIKFNRPKSLNAFGGNLIPDTIAALRELDQHPETVFTVLTGEGRFFSAGADVKAEGGKAKVEYKNDAEKKLAFLARFSTTTELLRSLIDHRKVVVLALNGPGVGGGAAWFQGIADIFLAASGAYLQAPFSALGLVPENGSAISLAQSMGVHRANDFLMFGRKVTVEELERWGLVNRIFPKDGFHEAVLGFLREQLEVNDGKSMMEMKRLQNAPRRDQRMIAVVNAMDALAERFVEDAPVKRFEEKRALLESKSKNRTSKI